MQRPARFFRWLMGIGAAGVMPAFILDCDKAALLFQRSFIQGVGENISDLLLSPLQPTT